MMRPVVGYEAFEFRFVDRLMGCCRERLGAAEPVHRRQNAPLAEPFRQLGAANRHSTLLNALYAA